MLSYLNIRNIVLIKALEIDCGAGLSALTGETGAGKSILLDALGLALGVRAETALVRKGAEKAEVTATFSLSGADHPVYRLFEKQDMDIEKGEEIILRRSLTEDGRSRAFINDRPVSIGLLREAGERLVEIHGQFETHGLLHVKTHRAVLDRYGSHTEELSAVAAAWKDWRAAEEALARTRADLEKSRTDEDYLKHQLAELDSLAAEAGEEERLGDLRKLLGSREKICEAAAQCRELLSGGGAACDLVAQAQSLLEKAINDITQENLTGAAAALDRAAVELDEALAEIENIDSSFDHEDMSLDMIEERLFALRDCARKHGCSVGELPQKREEIAEKLNMIAHQDEALEALEAAEHKAREDYAQAAAALTARRNETARRLEKLLLKELPLLKLDKVQFVAEVKSSAEPSDWTAEGADRVRFLVATNPGQEPAPLEKVASGGELSRLMLAFKVVMAGKSRIPCLIFDEIDSGIGGAVADAVGAHLKRLSAHHQVLVVTHSPQVAAKADCHLVISKTQGQETLTDVTPLLTAEERREEIARMLSGRDVTEEARAAAEKLIGSIAA
ncbi:MAG: DNA repair protein RecN [Micavibrio sp.]|nr:MAG: DNA repair protein RecN [Micavibrio sp.]